MVNQWKHRKERLEARRTIKNDVKFKHKKRFLKIKKDVIYIYTMEYYSDIKNNEMLPFVTYFNSQNMETTYMSNNR